MGDLKVAETFQDAVYITVTATGAASLGLAPTCTFVKISNNTRTAGTVQEVGSGWYRVTDFTNDAAGTWATEWGVAAGNTIWYPRKIFKVGGGDIDDIELAVAAANGSIAVIDAFHDVPVADTNNDLQMRDVIGRKTDTQTMTIANTSSLMRYVKGLVTNYTATRAGYLDELDFDLNARLGAPAGASLAADLLTIDNLVDDLEGRLTALRAGYLDELDFDLNARLGAPAGASLAADLLTIDNFVDDLETRLTAARAGYMDKIANHLVTRTWFSPSQISVTVTAAAPNLALPSVVLPNITGTVVAAYAGFKFRMIENTNAGANKIDTTQYIQVKESVGGAYTNAIQIVDDQFGVAATTREGGDCVIGGIDVVAQVTAFNKTYNFQWTAADADLANLVFNDVQTFLIVSYY